MCQRSTSGPADEPSRSVNIGVAAHITGASNGGPRHEPNLTANQRRSAENGIWLCQNCAKLIDSDVCAFTVKVLHEWKSVSESRARDELLGIVSDYHETALDLIRAPRLGWMAGMAYNACFQTVADGEIDSDNFRGLIYQAQPLFERLGIAISLFDEMSKPNFLQERALPLEFRIGSELEAIYGRVVSAAFSLGKNLGPTTGLLMRYFQDGEVRNNIQKQNIAIEGLTAAVDDPLKSLRSVLGQDVLDEWSGFKQQVAGGSASGATAVAIDRWRHRIREIMTE